MKKITHRATKSSNMVLCLLMLLTVSGVTNAFSPNPSLLLHKTHRISPLLVRRGITQPTATTTRRSLQLTSHQQLDVTYNDKPSLWKRIFSTPRPNKSRRFLKRIQRILPVLSVLFLLPLKAMASDVPPSMASPIPAALEFQLTLRLALAAFLGAGLGKERSIAKHSAGVRTMALVAMGASAFTVCSLYGFNVFGAKHDPGRMASQVASGVGFVGAGVITSTSHLNGRNIVHGLTTAATIWLSAAVGVACGTGLYQVATAAAALTIFILRLGRIHPKPAIQEPSYSENNKNHHQQQQQRNFIPSELSATPLDWQHAEDDDSFAETHDTAEWDEHHHTVQLILDHEMPPVIQQARQEIEEENHRLSLLDHDSNDHDDIPSSKVEHHAEPKPQERIVIVHDPEIADIMRLAMQSNHTNHQEIHIQNMQRFEEMANKTVSTTAS